MSFNDYIYWHWQTLQETGKTHEEIYEYEHPEVVRCKDCKWVRYCETEDLDLYLDCDKPDGGGIPRSEEWFCADGEREESE